MLAVIFLSIWIGFAAAMTGRGRWFVAVPLTLVVGLAIAGEIAAIYYAAWLTPLGALAFGLYAGFTATRRANALALGVVVLNTVAYGFLGLGRYDPPTLDGGTRFALIALGLYAVPALLGRAMGEGVRGAERRELREREVRRQAAVSRRTATPPPPRG